MNNEKFKQVYDLTNQVFKIILGYIKHHYPEAITLAQDVWHWMTEYIPSIYLIYGICKDVYHLWQLLRREHKYLKRTDIILFVFKTMKVIYNICVLLGFIPKIDWFQIIFKLNEKVKSSNNMNCSSEVVKRFWNYLFPFRTEK